MKTHSPNYSFRSVLCSVALVCSSGFCLAEPCPPDEEPDVIPQRERLDDAYQPHIYDQNDTTVLQRLRFTPPGYGQGSTHPTVISIPPTVFKNGDAYGTPSQRIATRDLKQAGFLVFQVEHRLAPPGRIFHQPRHDDPASGRPPQQSDDIKQQILAALADPHCNQTILLIGGSSGGCHALWVALDSASSYVPGWGPEVVEKIKAVVSLSGPSNLSSREANNPDIRAAFEVDVENYTNVYDDDPDWETKQYAVSPIKFVQNATYIPPIRLYATFGEPVPWQQGDEMETALDVYHPTADVQFYIVNGGALHAFNYWHEINDVTTDCVSAEVIEFLQLHD